MKARRIPCFLLGAFVAAGALVLPALGPLDPPPGPVAPTPGPEPRTALSQTSTPGDAAAVFRITRPGSYYLAANLAGESGKSGIVITADDVTLDLMGFSLSGVAGSRDGVRVEGARSNIAVRNGTLRGWGATGFEGAEMKSGTLESLNASGGTVGITCGSNVRLTRCLATENQSLGLGTGSGCVLTECAAISNGGPGIACAGSCTLSMCVARFNAGGDGIYLSDNCQAYACTSEINNGHGYYLDGGGTLLDGCSGRENALNGIASIYETAIRRCTVEFNAQNGIWVIAPCVIADCIAANNDIDGISTLDGCEVSRCTARQNSRHGVSTREGARLRDNTCDAHAAGAGLFASGAGNRLEANSVSGNLRGLEVVGVANLVARNSASGNTQSFVVAPGNLFAPVVTQQTIGTSTNPQANFEL